MNNVREVAKFASGAEAFHAFFHAMLGLTGTTLTVFDITAGTTWHIVGAIINALISLAFGYYAWGRPEFVSRGGPTARLPAR